MRELPDNFNKNKEFKLPYTFYENQIKYDASSELKISARPKLFIAGQKDTTVESERVIEAYNLSSQPKELETINSDHDYRFNTDTINKVNVLIEKFLEKYPF